MQIPGYKIIRKINQGGMSTVYLAVQLSVGRQVALKVMSPVLNADPVFSQRFQREANIVGQLPHPNIVSIYDIGCYKGLNYIAMDYLPGGTVHERMRAGMSATEILQVMKEMSRALDLAHSKGYVHRDIKPENILFRDDGSAVLTDFGVAKAARVGTRVTNAGTVVGTPHYMSPEQSRGMAIDGRSDLYSLGIVFFEMLTGVVPYQAEEAVAIAIKHLSAPIPTLPPHYAIFQSLLNHLLAKEADERFQCGADIVEAIVAIEESLAGPRSTQALTDAADMNVMVLLRALALTTVAALRFKAGKFFSTLTSLRWNRERGFYRQPRASNELHGDPDTVVNRQTTLVNGSSAGLSPPGRTLASRSLVGIALLAFIWMGASLAYARFDGLGKTMLPAGLERALLASAGAADALFGRFSSQTDARLATAKTVLPMAPIERAPREQKAEEPPAPDIKVEAAPRFSLTVTAEPADSRVRILNIRERYQPGIALEPGAYHLELSRPGFHTIKEWLRILDRDLSVSYQLESLHPPGSTFTDALADGSPGPEMVVIPPGSFRMGRQGEASRSPEHQVDIAYKLGVSRYEVTFALFEQYSRTNNLPLPDDKGWGRGSRPVINVNWQEAVDFARWLSEQSGQRYRLPTEAEWEYFARAGSKGDYWWGDEDASGKANCKRGCASEYTGFFSSRTAPVGSYAANDFKLFDTAGNVAEWVQDCFQNHYVGAPRDGSALEQAECSERVLRGGAANDNAKELLSDARRGEKAERRSDMIGFRLVREFD